jgi:predicted kinase
MKTLVVTLGITGAGKTTWLKDKSPVIETDDLRVELLDDINNEQDSFIFGTAAKAICILFDTHDTVYFGATLVNSKHRIPFLQSIKDRCKHKFVIDVVIFPCIPKLSKKRITNDLKHGVLRADSVKYVDKQYEEYLYTMSNFDQEKDFYGSVTRAGEYRGWEGRIEKYEEEKHMEDIRDETNWNLDTGGEG